jgi:hypothetical protein
MWFKHRAWIPVGWVVAIANVVAIYFAALPGEALHATVHGLLGAGFALGARHLTVRQRMAELNGQVQETLDLNEHLQQTVENTESRLRELEERVDFTERMLATQRDAERLRAPPQ